MSYKELIDNVYNDLKAEGRKVYKKTITEKLLLQVQKSE